MVPPRTCSSSPGLRKAQQLRTGQAILQFTGAVGQLAQVDPTVMDKIDTDAVVDHLHAAMGPPPAVLRDPRQVEDIRAQRSQAQAAQVQLDQTAQAVQITAEAAHAAQAASTTKGRSK